MSASRLLIRSTPRLASAAAVGRRSGFQQRSYATGGSTFNASTSKTRIALIGGGAVASAALLYQLGKGVIHNDSGGIVPEDQRVSS